MLFGQAVILTLYCYATGAAAQSITVSSTPPNDASNAIDKHFLGLGIEAVSFPQYTGNKTHPNEFSLNMFSALTSRLTNLPIRVGGTSLDFSHWNASQNFVVTYENPNDTGLTSKKTFGAPWLDGFNMVPGAKWVFMVPLAFQDLPNAVTFAKAGYGAMSSGSFHAFEIGNEPNAYAKPDHVRNSTWDEAQYVSQWVEWTAALIGNISLPPEPNFWALSLSSRAPTNAWSIEGGFTSTPSLGSYTQRIQVVSQHYYQTTVGSGTLQGSLLDPSKTSSTITKKSENAIAYLASRPNPTIPFVFGEVGDSLGGGSQGLNHTLQSSLGSALWYVNFMLQSMAVGVQRVNLQNIDVAGFSAWWPVAVNHPKNGAVGPPTVWATWYAMVLIADLISSTKGTLRVAPLAVSGSDTAEYVAYAAYDGGSLSKIVLINEMLWTTSTGGSRPTASFAIDGLGSASSVRIDRLSGPSGDETQNVTWAGQQWSYASNGLPVTTNNDTTTARVGDGSVKVDVPATEAAVLTVNY